MVQFRNKSPLDISCVALSYHCGMQAGACAVEHVPSGGMATITFPVTTHEVSYSFVVTFSDGTMLTADERLAYGGYAATEAVSHSQSLYDADFLSFFSLMPFAHLNFHE